MNFQLEILNSIERYKSQNAFCIGGKFYTYEELGIRIQTISSKLRQLNIQQNCLIGVFTYDHIDTYASLLAAMISGYGFVPVNINYPENRNLNILEQAGIGHILSAGLDDYSKKFGKNYSVIDTCGLKAVERDILLDDSNTEQIKCILFTSGSTGQPKGVPYTAANINTTLDSFFEAFCMDENDRVLQMFELTFDMSMLSYLPALCKGACVYTVPSTTIRYLSALKIMREYQISFAAMVPSTLSLLKNYFKDIKLPHLKYSVLGGEAFYLEIARHWAKSIPSARIVNISGPAECCMACMGYLINRNWEENKTHQGILAFGKPWKNTKAIVVNEQMELCKTGEIGELCFSGKNVMTGYWNLPELNNEVFFEKEGQRFYRTGDMVFLDRDGCFMTCGRKDQQVKIQGFKVELAEIEAHAREIAGHEKVVALAYKNARGLYELFLFIEKGKIDKPFLASRLRKMLPGYMLPSEIFELDAIPISLNGKVDRVALKAMIKKENGQL